jgi:hypothetical protein
VTRAHRALLWALNLLVPGAGLVLSGRLAIGIVAGLAWAVAAGMAIITALVHPRGGSPGLTVLVAAAPLIVYGAAQFALAGCLRARTRSAQAPDRDARFRDALVAYVQGRLDESEAACRALLRSDPDDVEAMLQLASIARRRNDARLARRRLARARYLDDAGRWDFEIERELAALAGQAGGKA